MADLNNQIQSDQPQAIQQASTVPGIASKPSFFQSAGKLYTGLSLREKGLIWALLIVLLVLAVIFLLIIPANDRLASAQGERDTLRSEQATTLMTIAAISMNQETLDSAQAEHQKYLTMYQAPLHPEDVDRMITTLIMDCGFSPSALTLTTTTSEFLTAYTPAIPATQVQGVDPNEEVDVEATGDDETAGGGGTAAGTGDTPSQTYTGAQSVLVFDVEVVVTGQDQNFYNLLDKVLPLTWMKITSSSYMPNPRWAFGGESGPQTCTVHFRIYSHIEATKKTI